MHCIEGVLLTTTPYSQERKKMDSKTIHLLLCGEYRARTDDLLHAMQAL